MSPSKDAQREELSIHGVLWPCAVSPERELRESSAQNSPDTCSLSFLHAGMPGAPPSRVPLLSPTATPGGNTVETWPSDGDTGLRFKPFVGSQVLLSHISFDRLVRSFFPAEPWKRWQTALSPPRDSAPERPGKSSASPLIRQAWAANGANRLTSRILCMSPVSWGWRQCLLSPVAVWIQCRMRVGLTVMAMLQGTKNYLIQMFH